MSVKQMMEVIGLKHRPTFLENYLNPSIANGYVRLLYPDSPRHPRQKYLLTVKGITVYNVLESDTSNSEMEKNSNKENRG